MTNASTCEKSDCEAPSERKFELSDDPVRVCETHHRRFTYAYRLGEAVVMGLMVGGIILVVALVVVLI